MARTTLVLDEALIQQAMILAGTHTKTETVQLALRELVRARLRRELIEAAGTFELSLTVDELLALRDAD